MNYKLIEKLAKLANNNPNEYEANMAARKVCKLLAEANFKFQANVEPIGVRNAHPPVQQSSSDLTYDAVKDMMNNLRKEQERQYAQYVYGNPFKTGSYQSPFVNEPPHQYHPNDEKYYSRRRERGFGNTKRRLVCKKCKQTKETIFVGLPEVFECNECVWNKL